MYYSAEKHLASIAIYKSGKRSKFLFIRKTQILMLETLCQHTL